MRGCEAPRKLWLIFLGAKGHRESYERQFCRFQKTKEDKPDVFRGKIERS